MEAHVTKFSIHYPDPANDEPPWEGEDQFAVPAERRFTGEPVRRRKTFEVPAIVKTGGAIVIAGSIFFGAEALAPANFKPSHLVGSYEAAISEQVKAAELRQQAKFDSYVKQVELANAQNVEQYKANAQAVLAGYNASWDRAKIFADATAKIQTQYVAYRMDQVRNRQSPDIGIANLARLWGRVANVMSPGSGDSAMEYSNRLGAELEAGLTAAAQNGQQISVEGWDTDLPSPAEVEQRLAALKPAPLPPPPSFAVETK